MEVQFLLCSPIDDPNTTVTQAASMCQGCILWLLGFVCAYASVSLNAKESVPSRSHPQSLLLLCQALTFVHLSPIGVSQVPSKEPWTGWMREDAKAVLGHASMPLTWWAILCPCCLCTFIWQWEGVYSSFHRPLLKNLWIWKVFLSHR